MTAIPILIALLSLGQAPAESPKSEALASEASLKVLQQRAETTEVSISKEAARKVTLVEKPVFRYSDELRHIEDAGIWLWTDRGRPVAAMKVERYKVSHHPRQWLYCFASLSSELITAEWQGDPTFQARKPGVTWKALDDKPATNRATRLIQMREMARRFAAELQDSSVTKDLHQMRLLNRPLYRYDDGLTNVVDGAVFGFTGTGTNPDVLLLLELTKDGGWQFGITGMTAWGATVRLKDNVVWQIQDAVGKSNVSDNWLFFVPSK